MFEGVYEGNGDVYYVSLTTGEVIIENKKILLEIKNITPDIY